MQALIVKEDKKVRATIAFILETELGVKVKEATTIQDGLAALLDDDCKFDVLICDDNSENLKLFKYLMTGDMQTRCLVLKDPKIAAVLAFPELIAGYINPSAVSEEIKKHFAEKFSESKPDLQEGEDGQYCRIRAIVAMQRMPLAFELFVRLSSQKYVRIFKKGDSFTEKDSLAFLHSKQIEYLFCHKKDAASFATQLKEDMEKNFKLASATPEGATKAASQAQEAVMELGNRIGFTPEVQALAKQGMLMTVKTIGAGKPQLSKIIKGILADKDRYLGSHAILTAQISCSLAHSMEWSSETTFQKLNFASFFHDMIIVNNKLAQIKDLAELEAKKSDFTVDEYKRYKTHPMLVSQMILTFSEVPADVDLIIAQHHERPDGTGFPRGLTGQNIAPLAALFIVSHDIVDYIFAHGTSGIDEFFRAYREKHSIGYFKKILAQIDLKNLGIADEPATAAPAKAAAPSTPVKK